MATSECWAMSLCWAGAIEVEKLGGGILSRPCTCTEHSLSLGYQGTSYSTPRRPYLPGWPSSTPQEAQGEAPVEATVGSPVALRNVAMRAKEPIEAAEAAGEVLLVRLVGVEKEERVVYGILSRPCTCTEHNLSSG